MSSPNPQVPWTDDQWEKVTQAIQEEANRARVAASFLDLFGPLPADTDFVRDNTIGTADASFPPPPERLVINDTDIIKLPTLQVKVYIRGAQMADPDLSSVLTLFRRSANILARLEDAVIFNGQPEANLIPCHPAKGSPSLPWFQSVQGLDSIWQILGGGSTRGLLPRRKPDGAPEDPEAWLMVPGPIDISLGNRLVQGISDGIGRLEGKGHFAPFAVVLGQSLFTAVQTPNPQSLVLPQDRILPFLSGGPLLRSTLLPPDKGVLVALGGTPLEIVVATDISLNFLQVTTDPMFVFRIFEKLALRIKYAAAIMGICLIDDPTKKMS